VGYQQGQQNTKSLKGCGPSVRYMEIVQILITFERASNKFQYMNYSLETDTMEKFAIVDV
jgi:hypothetical protein